MSFKNFNPSVEVSNKQACIDKILPDPSDIQCSMVKSESDRIQASKPHEIIPNTNKLACKIQ